MDRNTPTVLSLCSGAGGLELGIKLAVPDSRAVCYVEGEAYAASILAARMEDATMDAAPVWSDVKSFDPTPWRGCVDIVTAGYPCQPFSIAGRKQAEADPRHLWPFIRDIVRAVEPRLCFFENVSHHLRLGFEQVHDDLRSMGFGVAAGLFTAEEVGASHKRERLFILAHAEGAGAWLDQSRLSERFSGDGAALAHAPRIGERRTAGHVSGPDAGSHRPGAQLPDGASENMAHADSAGLEGYAGDEPPQDAADFIVLSGIPLWPPCPGEYDAWGSVPDALKPSLHRMADGMAHRVDRIRACGNGVVPLAAAYAFCTLAASLDP